MDTTIVLNDTKEIHFFNISDYEDGAELFTKIIETFGSIGNIDSYDSADFPDNILKWENKTEFEAICHKLVDYSKALNDISDYQEDAFKAYIEEYGGIATELVEDFNNRFAGDFKDIYDFGVDMAKNSSMNLNGNESYFNFKIFGEDCAHNYMTLKERYYFRN